MTLTMLGSVWAVLFIAVLGLAGYRKFLASHEDDTIHLSELDNRVAKRQTVLAMNLSRVDRWGKVLTVVVVVYGLALLLRIIYIAWLQSGQLSSN